MILASGAGARLAAFYMPPLHIGAAGKQVSSYNSDIWARRLHPGLRAKADFATVLENFYDHPDVVAAKADSPAVWAGRGVHPGDVLASHPEAHFRWLRAHPRDVLKDVQLLEAIRISALEPTWAPGLVVHYFQGSAKSGPLLPNAAPGGDVWGAWTSWARKMALGFMIGGSGFNPDPLAAKHGATFAQALRGVRASAAREPWVHQCPILASSGAQFGRVKGGRVSKHDFIQPLLQAGSSTLTATDEMHHILSKNAELHGIANANVKTAPRRRTVIVALLEDGRDESGDRRRAKRAKRLLRGAPPDDDDFVWQTDSESEAEMDN